MNRVLKNMKDFRRYWKILKVPIVSETNQIRIECAKTALRFIDFECITLNVKIQPGSYNFLTKKASGLTARLTA